MMKKLTIADSNKKATLSHWEAARCRCINSDRYRVCWHFAGAISVSRMQSPTGQYSGCTVYA